MTETQAVKTFRGLVAYHAHRFRRPGLELEDLVQEGSIAVVIAHRTWRPDGGSALKSWVVTCLVHRFIGLLEKYRRTLPTISLDAPQTDSTGDDCTLHNLTGRDATQFDEAAVAELWQRARAQLDRLSPREHRILRLHFDSDLSHTEIADELGCSRQRVSQLYGQAIDTMRTRMGAA